MKKNKLMWSLTGISAVLGFVLTVQITSRLGTDNLEGTSYIDLRTQVAEQLQEHQILEKDISKETAQLAEFQAAEGSRTNLRAVLEKDADMIAQEAGLHPVSGPGLVITIQDDPTLPYDSQFSGTFAKSSDQWISLIVNNLFANGASAISINGQRLVTTSSIRLVSTNGLDGGLQVNTHPIVMPYVIKATGSIQNMTAALTVAKIVQQMNIMSEDCIIKPYSGRLGVSIPGYTGPLPGVWAKEGNNS